MKTLRILSNALIALSLIFCASACNSDDDGPDKPKPVEPISAKVSYKLYVEKDLLEYAGVVVNYTKNGKVEKVRMTDENSITENNRQFCVLEINWPNQKLPIKEIVTAKFDMQVGTSFPEQIGVSTGNSLSYTITYSDGTTVPGGFDKKFNTMTVSAEKFGEYLQRLNQRFDAQEIEIEVEDDGHMDIDFDD